MGTFPRERFGVGELHPGLASEEDKTAVQRNASGLARARVFVC